MMKKCVHVKPLTSKTEVFGWVTLELTAFENLIDDIKRYGVGVALFNVWYLIKNRMV